jgi:hypothetical protein
VGIVERTPDRLEHLGWVEGLDELARIAEGSAAVAAQGDRPVRAHHVLRHDSEPVEHGQGHGDRATRGEHDLVALIAQPADLGNRRVAERPVFAQNGAVDVEGDEVAVGHAVGSKTSRPPT